jgi:hypothetical protein
MKHRPKLSSLACAIAFAAGVSLPALADCHHAAKHDARQVAAISQSDRTARK